MVKPTTHQKCLLVVDVVNLFIGKVKSDLFGRNQTAKRAIHLLFDHFKALSDACKLFIHTGFEFAFFIEIATNLRDFSRNENTLHPFAKTLVVQHMFKILHIIDDLYKRKNLTKTQDAHFTEVHQCHIQRGNFRQRLQAIAC